MKLNMINYNHILERNIQLHCMDCDSFVLSVRTQNRTNLLKNTEDLFDFSNLNENHELFSDINKKVVAKFENGTPKKIWIDEFVALRNKACSFNCIDKNTNKLKGISKSQPKQFKFEEYYNGLFVGEYQKNLIII